MSRPLDQSAVLQLVEPQISLLSMQLVKPQISLLSMQLVEPLISLPSMQLEEPQVSLLSMQLLEPKDQAAGPTVGVVVCGEDVVYLMSPGRPTDFGVQLGKASYPFSR